MAERATDYLIVGAGASALAFADALLDHTDAEITLVDRRDAVGGHWNDAYPFVRLHQPSSFYGAHSRPLGRAQLEHDGLNAGFEELATGVEVRAYFHALLKNRLLPSGRVTFIPMTEVIGDSTLRNLMSGETSDMTVRGKIVDARFCENQIPSLHVPRFEIADGTECIPPNLLPHRAGQADHFTVLGAGKTAMDSVVWLLERGADPARIRWVVPRDPWVINRRSTQPGGEFYFDSVGGYARQLECLAAATSPEHLGALMEEADLWLRLDPDVTPTIIHGATIAPREMDRLREVRDVVRMGRVTAIAPTSMTLEAGELSGGDPTLYVDCTASALRREPTAEVFQDGRIVLQMIRLYQPTFSTALIALIESLDLSDSAKNGLSAPVAMTDDIVSWIDGQRLTMTNQFAWSQNADIKGWMRTSRLDGFGRAAREVDRTDPEVAAVFDRLKTASMPAIANMMKLTAEQAGGQTAGQRP